MKSEHRHELKTNELERITSEWGHSFEHYVQDNLMLIGAAVVVVVLAIGGALYWRSASGVSGQQGWREFAAASKAADYANVADKFAGTPAGSWARLIEGEIELSSGIRSSFTDRAAGRSDLKKSQENFEKLVNDKSDDVRERALFGLARAREALPEKNLGPSKINDAAIEAYQRLVTEFSSSVYKDYADARIAVLKTGTAQDFYAWFEQQNPKPADREMPKDLIPPSPDETKTAPGTPFVPPKAPTTDAAKSPSKAKGPSSSSKTEPPKAGTKPAPASASPAKPTASSKTPATDDGPAVPAPTVPAGK